ncbi:MAG TPA: hypothetical protein PLA43_14855 [Bryobacteraceae bacterium]|nr:hypothetical protein [Bryobacteraceae bacterium]HOL70635.1 hypothetical protein [Bryobacteraceae bacterium]HOQ45951.1 hypothetical protein [Bryobacteraceae bacterium]HPQ16721.1 hypothetical protein [Bryobacteraceae bacterium]HPU73230.1 hypothetical protein [Bryobacteraceae bacterium]
MSNAKPLVRALRGPLLLMILGTLFAVDYFGPYPFYRTWPVLLIAYGVLWLLERVIRDTPAEPESPFGGPL